MAVCGSAIPESSHVTGFHYSLSNDMVRGIEPIPSFYDVDLRAPSS